MTRELLIALIGVGGTLLAAMGTQWVQVLHARRQRRWALEDVANSWKREREARLFECRRTAYSEFVLASEQWPQSDAEMRSLYHKYLAVSMYGTADTAAKAEELFGSHAEHAETNDQQERSRAGGYVMQDHDAFVAAVRADLAADSV